MSSKEPAEGAGNRGADPCPTRAPISSNCDFLSEFSKSLKPGEKGRNQGKGNREDDGPAKQTPSIKVPLHPDIQEQTDGQHGGEHRGPPIAHQGEGNPDHRHEARHHSHIHDDLQENHDYDSPGQ